MFRTRIALIRFAVAVAALLASPPLFGHDLWIAPSSFTPGLGEPIRLQLVLADGERIETVPRNEAGIVRFAARGPGGEQPVAGLDGVAPAGFLRPATPGWYTIVYESSPTFTALSPDTFRAYLQEKGLEPAPRPQVVVDPGAAVSTTEIFRRSIKARVLVGAPGGAAPPDLGEETPAGLPFELVLERVAGAAARNDHEVVIRLLLEGEPLAGAQVDLRPVDGRAAVASGRTDSEGRVRVQLTAGSWVATSVHLDPSRPATAADWESVWSSLTFHLD
jgi:uncharacterized GH25 family protein